MINNVKFYQTNCKLQLLKNFRKIPHGIQTKIIKMSKEPVLNKLVPDFALPDQDGVSRKLSDFIGEWVLLFFYLKDDTPI